MTANPMEYGGVPLQQILWGTVESHDSKSHAVRWSPMTAHPMEYGGVPLQHIPWSTGESHDSKSHVGDIGNSLYPVEMHYNQTDFHGKPLTVFVRFRQLEML